MDRTIDKMRCHVISFVNNNILKRKKTSHMNNAEKESEEKAKVFGEKKSIVYMNLYE